jgi:hypothetical protein
VDVVRVALPLLNVAAPTEFVGAPSKTVIVPVALAGLTFTVRVTVCL